MQDHSEPNKNKSYPSGAAIKDLDVILKDHEKELTIFLPSLHRVQKIFGPEITRAQDEETLASSLFFDMTEISGVAPTEASSLITLGMGLLKQSEVILTKYTEQEFPLYSAPLRTEILHDVIWRHWENNAKNAPENIPLAHSIFFLTLSSVKHSSGLQRRKEMREKNSYNDETVRNESHSFFLPEEETILDELRREFLQTGPLSTYTRSMLSGNTLQEIAKNAGIKIETLKFNIEKELANHLKKGVATFGWTPQEVDLLMAELKQLSSKKETYTRGMSDTEMWGYFKTMNLDIVTLFSILQDLYLDDPLAAKCILHKFGYINAEKQIQEFAKLNQISHRAYSQSVLRAVTFITTPHPEIYTNGNKTEDINKFITYTESYFPKRTTARVLSNKQSTVLEISQLDQTGSFSQMQLSPLQRDLVLFIRKFQQETSMLPSYREMSAKLKVPGNIIRNTAVSLLHRSKENLQHSTESRALKQDSSRVKFLTLKRSLPIADFKLLLNMFPLDDRYLIALACQVKKGQMLSIEEITEGLAKLGFEYTSQMHPSSRLTTLYNRLERSLAQHNDPLSLRKGIELQLQAARKEETRAIMRRLLFAINEGEVIGRGLITRTAKEFHTSPDNVRRILTTARKTQVD